MTTTDPAPSSLDAVLVEAALTWIDENAESIDAAMDVMTEKAIRNKGKVEISCGNNIEFFSHGITPEIIILFREHCELTGQSFEDALEDAGLL